jgi:hypothetical protein
LAGVIAKRLWQREERSAFGERQKGSACEDGFEGNAFNEAFFTIKDLKARECLNFQREVFWSEAYK